MPCIEHLGTWFKVIMLAEKNNNTDSIDFLAHLRIVSCKSVVHLDLFRCPKLSTKKIALTI